MLGALLPETIEERSAAAYSLQVTELKPIANRISLLILQHPQEQDRALGTARLAASHFANSTFRVGLSWPSLAAALGRPADPKRWAVLYLGSAKPAELAPESEIILLDRKGEPAVDRETALASIEGVVLLDGTWSQAKALWWRNPWVLKCQRIVLNPRTPSRYGALRCEPRRDSLSTLEAAALVLSRLEERPEIERELAKSFETLLAGLRPALQDRRRPRRRRMHGGSR